MIPLSPDLTGIVFSLLNRKSCHFHSKETSQKEKWREKNIPERKNFTKRKSTLMIFVRETFFYFSDDIVPAPPPLQVSISWLNDLRATQPPRTGIFLGFFSILGVLRLFLLSFEFFFWPSNVIRAPFCFEKLTYWKESTPFRIGNWCSSLVIIKERNCVWITKLHLYLSIND